MAAAFRDALTGCNPPTRSSPANWQDLPGGSVTADSLGAFQYTDTSGSGSRYYRSAYP